MFNCNTTSFVVSEQLNKHVNRYEFLDEQLDLVAFHENAKDELPLTIDGFCLLIKPAFDELDSINYALSHNQKAIDECESKLDSLCLIIEKTRSIAIEAYKDQTLRTIKYKIDSLRCELHGKDSTEMVISGEYLKLTTLELAYAEKNKEVQDNILKHYGAFVPIELSLEYQQNHDDKISLIVAKQNLEQNRRDVSAYIRNTVALFHKNRRETVGLLDFLYYSVCVSTTTSFGDISPNNTLSRTISLIELLLCVFLIGCMINKISKSLDKKENK